MAEDYPFNVKENETYRLYLGVGNHMKSSAYYIIYVKFRNCTEPLPNTTDGTPSPLPALYEYRVIIPDGEVWEISITFSFLSILRLENKCLVKTLSINDAIFAVNKPAVKDVNDTGYYYQLFVELWIYNVESGSFEFHNRFVGIWLNITDS